MDLGLFRVSSRPSWRGGLDLGAFRKSNRPSGRGGLDLGLLKRTEPYPGGGGFKVTLVLEHRRDNLLSREVSPPSKRSRCFHPFPLSLATRERCTRGDGVSVSHPRPRNAQRHTWRHGSRARSTWLSRDTLGLGLGLPRLIPRRVALVATMPSISAGTLCTGAQPATPPGRMQARCSLPEHTHPP